MFVIVLRYLVDLETILENRDEHVAFLQHYYDRGIFIVSGPQKPRNGGIILAKGEHRETIEQIIMQDPFYKLKLAEYQIFEFIPVNFAEEFSPFIT